MANQMIALQTRGAKLPDPSAQTAKFVSMMNMTRQQEAAERQAALAQQQMDINVAREARDVITQGANMRKSDQDYQIANMTRLRDIGLTVLKSGNEEAYQDLVGLITDSDEDFGRIIKKVAPTLASNPNALRYVIDEASKYLEANRSKRTTQIINDAKGVPIVVDSGGDTEYEASPLVATKIRNVNEPPPSAPPPPPTPTPTPTPTPSPIPVGKYGEARVIPDSAVPLTDFDREDIRRIKAGSGMTNTPASFNSGNMSTPTAGQMTPDMVPAILDSAINTGVMAQIDLDQMIALAPPQARDGIMQVIRDSKIALQADAPSLVASAMDQQQPMAPNPVGRQQSTYADMRSPAPQASFADLGGQPEMQNTMAQYKVGDPIYGRNPSVSPAPVPVPPAILGAQEGAKTAASKSVDLRMDPEIAGATKKVENAIALRAEAPKAKYETKILVQGLDKYINAIDTLLRSPDRHLIVGRIEGNLHYLGSLGQNERQAELQAMYDMIKNTDTLSTLVQMKQSTPSGGSPVGNASNTDVTLVAKSANAATQTGGVPNFDKQLIAIRRDAYRARTNAIEFYSDKYGGLAAEDPKFKFTAPPIADRYTGPLKTPVIPTLTPEQVRANPKIKRWKRSDNGKVMTRP